MAKRLASEEKDVLKHRKTKEENSLSRCECCGKIEAKELLSECGDIPRHLTCNSCSRKCRGCNSTFCRLHSSTCELCFRHLCRDCGNDTVDWMDQCTDYGVTRYGCLECHRAERTKRRYNMQLYFALALGCPEPVSNAISWAWHHLLECREDQGIYNNPLSFEETSTYREMMHAYLEQ